MSKSCVVVARVLWACSPRENCITWYSRLSDDLLLSETNCNLLNLLLFNISARLVYIDKTGMRLGFGKNKTTLFQVYILRAEFC